jgi:hypothetical protein
MLESLRTDEEYGMVPKLRDDWMCDGCSVGVSALGVWNLPNGWTRRTVELPKNATSDSAAAKTDASLFLCPVCSRRSAAAVAAWLTRQALRGVQQPTPTQNGA